ncbi:MAG TPA: hypothetical protein VHI31_04815 [Actinomycetota bacterium]|nr:hypothetical protein [Actinomycetota bacterium]
MNLASQVAWEGKVGDADLKIEIPPSGRIHAEWRTPAGTRSKVVDSIEQLERSVLFQLIIGQEGGSKVCEEVADAVALSLANRGPSTGRDPAAAPPPRRRARPGGPPKRRGGAGGSRGRRRR